MPGFNSIAVIVHLTGLLVIVPPKRAGDMTYILMPDRGDHKARIGFEAPNRPNLCVQPYQGGICYVDLDVWSLDPIGAGGTVPTVTMKDFPRGIVNLTFGSGNQHRVDTSTLGNQVIATFLSGRPVDPPCSIGMWKYDPVGTPPVDLVPLANVVNWQMKLPQSSLQLVFRRGADTAIVTLAPRFGTIELLVAHLSDGELKRLPPARPNKPAPPRPDAQAVHFDALYDPLRVPNDQALRPLPRFAWPIRSDACPVKVRTFMATFTAPVWGIDTHSCMVAGAEPK